MTERKIKADLHMHPSFYNPQSGKKVPALLEIIERLLKRRLAISSLSAMHPKAECIDYRFFDYMKQLPQLERDFRFDYQKNKGILYVQRKAAQQDEIAILNSQEVRTMPKAPYADMNIIGVKRIIEPEQDAEETARIGKGEGGIVTICHPNDRCGIGLEKAIEMLHDRKIDGIEISAISSRKMNEEAIRRLEEAGIKGVSVSDSHYYTDAGVAGIMLPYISLGNFDIQLLGNLLRNQDFDNIYGQIGEVSKFMHHTSHVLASIPGHLIRNPKYIIGALSKRK